MTTPRPNAGQQVRVSQEGWHAKEWLQVPSIGQYSKPFTTYGDVPKCVKKILNYMYKQTNSIITAGYVCFLIGFNRFTPVSIWLKTWKRQQTKITKIELLTWLKSRLMYRILVENWRTSKFVRLLCRDSYLLTINILKVFDATCSNITGWW